MRLALFAPSLLKIRSEQPGDSALAGAETSLIHLHESLRRQGHEVICFANFEAPKQNHLFHATSDFLETDYEFILYSRTYGKLFANNPGPARRVLWLHDTIQEAASLLSGGLKELRAALTQYHYLVFVSAWHRLHYQRAFPNLIDWAAKSTSIYHLLPEALDFTSERGGFDVIHTAHPRKALSAVLDIYDRLLDKNPLIRLALVDSANLYQQRLFKYRGHNTSLSALLKDRYGIAGPRFTIIPLLPQNRLLPLLSKCKIFLHPDRSIETGATTLLEAIHAGCKPIVSDLGCLPELVAGKGRIMPVPTEATYGLYVDTILEELNESHDVPRKIEDSIRLHNATQAARWNKVLREYRKISSEGVMLGEDKPNYRDINSLVAHPASQTLKLEIDGLPTVSLGVQVFRERSIALLGVLEPTILPALNGDVDDLSAAYYYAIASLLRKLESLGIRTLIMRIGCQTSSLNVLSALTSACVAHGAAIATVRQLQLVLDDNQNDNEHERATMSVRAREQTKSARRDWSIKHITQSACEFDAWFKSYEQHLQRFSAIGLLRSSVRAHINSSGPCGVYGGLAIDPANGQICGFFLVIRVNDFAVLHSWGTNHRYKSNLHKLLIAEAIRLARTVNVKIFEYGSDLGEYGRNKGLNSLYRQFGGIAQSSLQMSMLTGASSLAYSVV